MRKFVEKRAWLRAHVADNTSQAELLSSFAKEFAMREEKAADELKELLDLDAETEKEFEGNAAQRHLALGAKLMDMMIAAKDFGSAGRVWKAMAQVKGLERPQQVDVSVSAVPNDALVRERIAKLMADKQVRETAEAAQLAEHVREQAEAAGVAGAKQWLSDGTRNPLFRANETAPNEASASEPASTLEPASERSMDPNSAGPENFVAAHVALVLAKK